MTSLRQPPNDFMPRETWEALCRYVEEGIETGGFLRAALANDFIDAVCKADLRNGHCLRHIAQYIHCDLPHECHGSYEKVDTWIKNHPARRRQS